MHIRTFERGDEAAQAAIYNEAAGGLPRFKPATTEEVRRRCRAADFDPGTRFYAIEGTAPVGYATFHANGRISFPWCRKGFESHGEELFQKVLQTMKQRGMSKAFTAYRNDWKPQDEFFLKHGFARVREMVNFVLDIVEMPTPAARPSSVIGPVRPADIPHIRAMVPEVIRVPTDAALEQHLLHNPDFPPDTAFVLRSRTDETPIGVGIVVADPSYADPRQVDPNMPCYRCGAFGTAGMQVKRINGLFSFVAQADKNANALGLDLLGQAAFRLRDTEVETLAAQVPSDVPHLLRFYQQQFRRQGSFPVYERSL